jgi:hypothetical protein
MRKAGSVTKGTINYSLNLRNGKGMMKLDTFNFVKEMPEGLSDFQRYIWLDKAEKEAKKEKDKMKAAIVKGVHDNNKFVKTDFGNIQWVPKETKSPLDTMKFFLANKGVLDVCKKDEIDLKKVDELIDAGFLSKEEVNSHIKVTQSSYVKVK